MSTINENITKGVKWTGISSIVNAIVKLIQVSVLAHILSPNSFGLIAIAYIFLSFGDIIVDMGLTTAVLHFKHIHAKQYASIFWINIILGLLISGIICLAGWPIGDFYRSSEVRHIVQLLSINILIISASRLHKTYLQKHMDFKIISIIEVIGAFFMCISAIIFALIGFGVYSLVFSNILASIIISVLFLYNAPDLNSQINLYISLRDMRDFYSIGIFQFLSSLVEFFSREIDIMFISSYFSTELLGYYTLCKQLAQRLFNVINPIIVRVAVPSLAILQDNILELKNYYSKMIRNASYINSFFYGTLAVCAFMILYYLYGYSYISYKWMIYIFAVYYAIQSIGSFTGILNTVLGKTKVGLVWSIYRVIVIIICCVCMYKCSFEIFVLGMTLGVQILNFYPGYYLTIKKYIPMSFISYIGAQAFPILFSLIACYLIVSGINFIKVPWLNGIIGGIVFSSAYYLFSIMTGYKFLDRIKKIVSI